MAKDNDYKVYKRSKNATITSNIGMWLMFCFDIVFFILIALSGFPLELFVPMAVCLGLELIAALLLLPIPVIYVGTKGAIIQTIVFAIFPLLIFAYGAMLGRDMLPLFAVIAACRLLGYFATFINTKNFRLGVGIFGIVAILCGACVFGVGAKTAEFRFFERPIVYTQNENGEYSVKNIFYGFDSSVTIPQSYKGRPVVSLGEYAGICGNVKRLTIPKTIEKIEYQAIIADELKYLTIESDFVIFDNQSIKATSLERIVFTSASCLPNFNTALNLEFGENTIIQVHRAQIDNALASFQPQYAEIVQPIVGRGENFVIFNTEYTRAEGGRIDGVGENTIITKDMSAVSLPEFAPRDDYAFIGWYDDAEYTNKVSELESGKNYHLRLKYLKQYSISLITESGDVMKGECPEKYHVETPTFSLPTVSRDGYTFIGWFASGGTPKPGEDIKAVNVGATGNLTYQTCFNKNYNVSYNFNGGELASPVVLPKTYYEWGGDVTLPTLNKAGYTFMGWFTDAAFTHKISVIRDDAGIDYNLRAKFNKNYDIIYEYNGGDSLVGMPSYYHVESETIVLQPLTRVGYNFGGWYTDAKFTGERVTSIEKGSIGSKTFYAKFTPITYSIKYAGGVGSTGAMANGLFTYDATNILGACGFSKTGYHFDGWQILGIKYAAGDTVKNFTSRDNDTVTATAVWLVNTYNIAYEGGGGTGSMNNSVFTYGASNTLRDCEFVKTGYYCFGWLINGERYTNNTIDINLTTENAITLTATALWERNSYTINYEGGAGATGEMQSSVFNYDRTNSLKANTLQKVGYTFSGWRIKGEIYPSGDTTVNFTTVNCDSLTATAVWTANTYTIKYERGAGATGGAVTSSAFTYDANNTLKDNGFNKVGYHFDGWKINGATYQAGDTTVNFTSVDKAELTATAVWMANTYAMQYQGGSGSTGDMTNSVFTYDATNTLKANTLQKTGYNFVGWKIDGVTYQVGDINVNFTSVNNTVIITATAVWTANTYTIKYERGEGATGEMTTSVFTYDATNALKANTLEKVGYTFGGWKINGAIYQAGNTTVNFTSVNNDGLIAAAVWNPITYTIKYEGGSGSTGDTTSSVFTYDATNALKACGFSKVGYHFDGWKISGVTYPAGDTKVNFTTVNSDSLTATAVWTANTYIIRYNGGAGATGDMTSSLFTYDAARALKANTLEKVGYTFDGWKINGVIYGNGASVKNLTAINGDILYAVAQWLPV